MAGPLKPIYRMFNGYVQMYKTSVKIIGIIDKLLFSPYPGLINCGKYSFVLFPMNRRKILPDSLRLTECNDTRDWKKPPAGKKYPGLRLTIL
jgi:hypothetical protein